MAWLLFAAVLFLAATNGANDNFKGVAALRPPLRKFTVMGTRSPDAESQIDRRAANAKILI